ncbi:MAG: hypothetical protein H6Q26_2021 [Bacteroidetes bacterium]|nr:hypothetical protein [Bacteroidota bacterium]
MKKGIHQRGMKPFSEKRLYYKINKNPENRINKNLDPLGI